MLTLGVFVATTRWMGWTAGIEHVQANDVASYLRMAEAAPDLPEDTIGSAFTDRFLVHWSIGAVADLTGLDVTWVYRAVWALAGLGVVLAIREVLRRLGLTGPAVGLCLGLLLLNPYAFRYYALAPGMVADLVFELGLAVALLGLVSRRYAVVLSGVVLAVAARQTTLVVAPVLAVWLVLELRRSRSLAPLLAQAAALVVVPLVLHLAVRSITADFSVPYAPRIPEDTILPLLGDLPGSAPTLVDHVLRVVAPLTVALALLVTAVALRLRAGGRPPLAAWLALAVTAAVVAQPLGLGPTFVGFAGNQPRLSALGVVPLVVCLGAVLTAVDLGRGRGRPGWPVLALAAVVVAASLHHLYTVVGPENVMQFVALQFLAAVAASVLLVVAHGAAARDRELVAA